MAQAMTGLFGPSADEVRLAIEQQGQDFDMQRAQMPAGRGAVALASQAGRMVGDVAQGLGGYQDPRVQSAQLMQEAAQEVDSQGFSLLEDPQAYYKAAYSSLMKRGLTAEAAHVRDLALNEQATQSKMALESAQAYKALQPEYGATRNGMIYGKNTGEVVREGTPSDPKSQIVSLYPPGTVRKGEVAPKTFDMSNPEKRQEALQLMSEGYIDDNALPGPEGKGQSITIEDKRGLNNTQWLQEVAKPQITQALALGETADKTITDAKTANEMLMSGNAPTGFGAQAISTLGRAAERFGVSEDTLSRWNANPSDATTLRAVHNQMIASIAGTLGSGGKVSAREIQLAAEAGPELWQTERGQYFLNNLIEAKARYDKQVAEKHTEIFSQETYQNNPMLGIQKVNEWKAANPFALTATMYDDFQKAYKDAKTVKNLPDSISTWKAGKLKTINQKVNHKGAIGYYWGEAVDPASGRKYPDIRREPKR